MKLRPSQTEQVSQLLLAEAINSFTFSLFQKTAALQPGTNLFLSPFSVYAALAMLANGAEGETKEAIFKVLGLPPQQAPSLPAAFARLREQLTLPAPLSGRERRMLERLGKDAAKASEEACEFEMGSAVWWNGNSQAVPAFADQMKQYFQATASGLDFRSPAALHTVNSWVREVTKGKIKSILDHIDPDLLLLLLNAVYFKGRWGNPFAEQKTAAGLFHTNTGIVEVPMMHMEQPHRIPHFKDASLEAVALPYGRGPLEMCLFLPATGRDPQEMVSKLSSATWDSWIRKLRPENGRIILPRFRIESTLLLNQPLKALGLGPAFSSGANFAHLLQGDHPLFISEVRHRSFLEVNEQGSEAAAVTAVGVARASFVPTAPFLMPIDRPFFLAIRNNKSGLILFTGLVQSLLTG